MERGTPATGQQARRGGRAALLLLAATALAGCTTPLNLLARLDGPYVSPEQRAEMAYRAAQQRGSTAPAPARVPATVITSSPPPASLAVPPLTPAPVPAPVPALVPALVPAATPTPAPLASPTAAATSAPRLAPAAAPVAAVTQPAALPTPTSVPTPTAQPVRSATASFATAFPAAAAADPASEPAPPPSPPPPRAVVVARLETAAPTPVAVLPPAPAAPLSPAAGLMGPVVTRAEPQGPLPTRLPSAYDLTPVAPDPVRRRPTPDAPAAATSAAQGPARELPALAAAPPAPASATAPEQRDQRQLERAAAAAGLAVVSALPAPGAPDPGSPGSSETPALRAFYDFAVARLDAAPSAGERLSMLLADPPSLDPALRRCGNLPPGVVIDVDPGNGLLPLVSTDRPNPDLARYLQLLRERGVTVYWISGHGPGAASQIRRRLVASGLDAAGSDPLVVTRFAGESKQARRYALGESHCLLAIMGDQRADFDELYDFVLDPIMAAPLEEHVNHGWFLAPAPLD